MASTNQSGADRLRAYHESHMDGGQDCYFSIVEDRLQPLPEQRLWLESHLEKATRLLDVGADETFLDLGCGEGFLTLPLARSRRQSFGFDFVVSALHALRTSPEYQADRLCLAVAGGDAIPLPDESVDKIICNHVLEHVLDDDAVLREFRRVLRPMGRILIGVPQALSPQVRVAMRLRRMARPSARRLQLEDVNAGDLVPQLVGVQSHVRFYSLSALYDLLKRNGFTVVAAEGIGLSWRGVFAQTVRRHRLLFDACNLLGKVAPGIGDGVLILAEKNAKK